MEFVSQDFALGNWEHSLPNGDTDTLLDVISRNEWAVSRKETSQPRGERGLEAKPSQTELYLARDIPSIYPFYIYVYVSARTYMSIPYAYACGSCARDGVSVHMPSLDARGLPDNE